MYFPETFPGHIPDHGPPVPVSNFTVTEASLDYYILYTCVENLETRSIQSSFPEVDSRLQSISRHI